MRERPARKEPGRGSAASRDFRLSKMTDHREVKVHSVIDVHVWDRAEWTGAAYGVAHPEASAANQDWHRADRNASDLDQWLRDIWFIHFGRRGSLNMEF